MSVFPGNSIIYVLTLSILIISQIAAMVAMLAVRRKSTELKWGILLVSSVGIFGGVLSWNSLPGGDILNVAGALYLLGRVGASFAKSR